MNVRRITEFQIQKAHEDFSKSAKTAVYLTSDGLKTMPLDFNIEESENYPRYKRMEEDFFDRLLGIYDSSCKMKWLEEDALFTETQLRQ